MAKDVWLEEGLKTGESWYCVFSYAIIIYNICLMYVAVV